MKIEDRLDKKEIELINEVIECENTDELYGLQEENEETFIESEDNEESLLGLAVQLKEIQCVYDFEEVEYILNKVYGNYFDIIIKEK